MRRCQRRRWPKKRMPFLFTLGVKAGAVFVVVEQPPLPSLSPLSGGNQNGRTRSAHFSYFPRRRTRFVLCTFTHSLPERVPLTVDHVSSWLCVCLPVPQKRLYFRRICTTILHPQEYIYIYIRKRFCCSGISGSIVDLQCRASSLCSVNMSRVGFLRTCCVFCAFVV